MVDASLADDTRTFRDLLSDWRAAQSVGSEDLLSAMLPLVQQVAQLHVEGRVAPLDGIDALRVSRGHLWFQNAEAFPAKISGSNVRKTEKAERSRIDVTGRYRERQDDSGYSQITDARLGGQGDEDTRQAYYPDYIAWEQRLEHHDPLSDIFVLGLLFGSLALQLDLSVPEELEIFAANRSDINAANSRIHPVLSQIIEKMTELNRERRPQDLAQLSLAIESYREQDVTQKGDLAQEAFDTSDRGAIRKNIQSRLRDRLFEINRRNRLIYFKETGASINLTVSSMPHVIDHKAIRPKQLFYLRDDIAKRLDDSTPLASWLQFEDYPYLSGTLDKIRLQAARDAREYGFSQLRLVAAFLRWTNLKDAPNERINSPLVLIPATLVKRKGVKDQFELRAQASRAEVNPALRHHLRSLYDISLPDTIDASNIENIRALHDDLRKQLTASAKGVELALVETPRIQLIHRTAKRKLDDFRRRRRRSGAGVKDFSGMAYSYQRDKYEPLGVQIFERDVRPSPAPNREMMDQTVDPSPLIAHMVAQPDIDASDDVGTKEVERSFYAIDDGSSVGTHDWEVDLCAMVLANFNYRKMTLVRDYTDLVDTVDSSHANFDLLFSQEARRTFDSRPPPTTNNYLVLPADPSQAEAVERASAGESYVIQGPPGTGKSQTITNLISDYVANGKAVLFVCEKRAALDVVFHRLKQVGLGDVCTLIHDSQGDKKAFIEELKEIYEAWIERKPRDTITSQRNGLLEQIDTLKGELDRFSKAMLGSIEPDGASMRDLIETRIGFSGNAPAVPARLRQSLPTWSALQAAKPFLRELVATLESAGFGGVLARAPVRLLNGSLADDRDAIGRIERSAPRAASTFTELESAVSEAEQFIGKEGISWRELLQVASACEALQPLAAAEAMSLLDPDSPKAHRLQGQRDKLAKKQKSADKKRLAASGWQDTTPTDNLDELLAVAREKEGSFFAIFSSQWRTAKRLKQLYYSAANNLSVTVALDLLADRIKADGALANLEEKFTSTFGIAPTPDMFALFERAWNGRETQSDVERDLLRACIDNPDRASRNVLRLGRENERIIALDRSLSEILTGYAGLPPSDLSAALLDLASDVELVPEFADMLADLDKAGKDVSEVVRNLDLPLEQIEVAVLDRVLDRAIRRDRTLNRFDSRRLAEVVKELTEKTGALRDLNGRYAVLKSKRVFHEDITRSNAPEARTSRNEKDWKRDFRRGRKALENEFQKSRAYKSIRELFAGEAGQPLRRLKPVWLMSPLSVADILPMTEELFDVVIFDEASQIPLEDAIPTLYRSRQMIVVGDEMQLPPSSFFSSQKEADEASNSDLVVYDLNADSFLNRASGALPRTMLSWHYRSQHEALIGFCNRAFYRGELQTIPSVAELPAAEPITVAENASAVANAPLALSRPLSFHKMAASPYGSQINTGEAQYIAELVRQILLSDEDHSIGVVAFSQAQQQQIETSISELAAKDKKFQTAIDLEEDREDDGQFVGLFVKNLENVQGDERDIIILSVCYGPDAGGRMIMNFGPINQNGGEKRLNVIFSRAKKHMMVISSIDGAQITNTYNFGANALRNYLNYARAASEGDQAAMFAALSDFANRDDDDSDAKEGQIVANQLAEALRERGLDAVRDYGQSDLKCHIAVRKPGDPSFRLAVQIDDRPHYDIDDTISRYVTRPSILSAFGWDVRTVLAKDWRADRDAVVADIERALSS